jgi:hypothetical protein
MGGHYGSVQVRSEDRDRVKAIAEQVAREKQIHILIAPPVNGWIALFPENNGQDDAVGRLVAEQLDGDALNLLVHDDDIFAYWYYRDRKLIDSYWSSPGYFGEENREREEKMAGNPELFRPLIGDKVGKLAELLDRNAPYSFEYERLEEFGKLLGMSNAVNAYEYLKEGDRVGIKNWKQFIEVPADEIEKEANQKKQERDRIAAERKRLKAEGRLLQIDERKAVMLKGCAAGDGFLVAWPELQKQTVSFNIYRAPWQEPIPITLGAPAHLASIASDGQGRRVAFTAGKFVGVWDLSPDHKWTHVCDVPEGDHAIAVALSPDGKLLAHASRKEIVVTQIDGRERLAAWATEATPQDLSFHPSGDWLVASGNTFGLLAIREPEPWRELYVGGKSNLHLINSAIFQERMREIDLDEVEKKQKASLDATIARMLKAAGASKQPVLSQQQIDAMKREMEKSLAEMTSRFREMKEGKSLPTPPQAREHVMCAGFSRDGQWLWCGTNVGLRVYEWSAVPRTAGADMPAPKWTFELPGATGVNQGKYVYAIAEERDAPAIVFGGITGRLYRLDLVTGESRELLNLDKDTWVLDLQISTDGMTLGISSRTVPSAGKRPNWKDERGVWSVWSYPRLKDAPPNAQ